MGLRKPFSPASLNGESGIYRRPTLLFPQHETVRNGYVIISSRVAVQIGKTQATHLKGGAKWVSVLGVLTRRGAAFFVLACPCSSPVAVHASRQFSRQAAPFPPRSLLTPRPYTGGTRGYPTATARTRVHNQDCAPDR